MIRLQPILMGFFIVLTFSGPTVGDEIADAEVEYLLRAVGQSGCTFTRNGTEHSPEKAESHLRLKYENGKRWANDADQFIERLATKSSWSGRLYYLQCGDDDPQPSGDWLKNQLAAYRQSIGYRTITQENN